MDRISKDKAIAQDSDCRRYAGQHQLARILSRRRGGLRLLFGIRRAETLRVAREIHPDVILLDVMMPVMDGLETCRQIRLDDELAQVPVVLVTAMAGEDDAVKGLDAGTDDYVTKPFNERIVAARV